jgi:hypothetical protein
MKANICSIGKSLFDWRTAARPRQDVPRLVPTDVVLWVESRRAVVAGDNYDGEV